MNLRINHHLSLVLSLLGLGFLSLTCFTSHSSSTPTPTSTSTCNNSIGVASALEINLSSLWNLFGYGDENFDDYRSKLVFPRRDLTQELGGYDQYQQLVQDALALEDDHGDNDSIGNGNGNGGDEDKEGDEYGHSDETAVDVEKHSAIKLRYGVDVSFPMQHEPNYDDSDNAGTSSTSNIHLNEEVSNLQKQQSKVYQNFIESCNKYYSPKLASTSVSSERDAAPQSLCQNAEKDRFDMNLNQPPMMQNYTMLGFQKTKIPNELYQQLKIFWSNHRTKQKMEAWGKDGGDGTADERGISVDTHVNHWVSPTYMVHIDNPYFEGGGMELKNYIWHVARQKLQAWINNGGGGSSHGGDRNNSSHDGTSKNDKGGKWTLSPTSMYGIRVYKENSILAPHVDRLPLVTSAIINVAQDVDEDWPLEVIGHDGVSYNVTMAPGDMLMYESHSVIHGRPYPLKGRYYANIFVHFEPSGHCMRHADRMEGRDVVIDDAKALYERAQERSKRQFKEQKRQRIKKTKPGMEDEGISKRQPTTPHYIEPGTTHEKRWNQQLEYDRDLSNDMKEEANFALHRIAGRGQLADVMYVVKRDPSAASVSDHNGWQPLHEAVRGGFLSVVEYLVTEAKVDINARTGDDGYGGSPLWWAKKFHGDNHPVTRFLKKHNAILIKPGDPKEKKSVDIHIEL